MRRIKDFDKVEAYGDRVEFPPAGGYVALITGVRDVADKEYLECLIDINEGDFKGFYTTWYKQSGNWLLRGYNSYKETAKRAFKGFITSVTESNKGFTWDWDEQDLKGKQVGIILREEEYINKDGEVASSLKIYGFRSVDAIRKGNFKVPSKKTVEPPKKATQSVSLTDLDDIQF